MQSSMNHIARIPLFQSYSKHLWDTYEYRCIRIYGLIKTERL